MRGIKLGLGLVCAASLIGAGAPTVFSAPETVILDSDTFNWSGNYNSAPGFYAFNSTTCTGTSVSIEAPVELAEPVDVENLNACAVQSHGTCQDTPGGPVWTGAITINEGQGSDTYQGSITVTWSGTNGTVSGALSEFENGPTGESGPLTGSMTSPFPPKCGTAGPVTGTFTTTA